MTPYEEDLQMPNREPSTIPKEGDFVKVKSKEWYNMWRNLYGYIGSFVSGMSDYCGKILPVEHVCIDGDFCLAENNYFWHLNHFEEIYPKEKYNALRIGTDYMVTPIGCPPVGFSGVSDIVAKADDNATFKIPTNVNHHLQKEKSKLKIADIIKPIKLNKV